MPQKKKKRRKSPNRKSKKKTSWGKYFLVGFIAITLLATGFYLKEKIAFYYASYFQRFEHKKLKNTASETERIDRIVGEYADKTFGLDISHYQNPNDIQWDSLSIGHRSIPLKFIILRATMGQQSQDRHFDRYWKKAKAHGLIRGAYHFYRPDEDPVKQATNFLENVKLEQGDLVPVLDIEKTPKKYTKAQLKENLKIWLKIVEEKYGKKPILYTYYHYYQDNLRGEFDQYPLWLANYNNVLTPSPQDPWLLWQFTENGIVYGINTKVDLNVFNGSLGALKQLTVE
ncbi:glycoside hydrolase family 25 protein [Bergeyella sp. RCAD1439]|uniref:glycoside hydrolase family 25 protein n=1 Tax=Bergeyella anatis TaxID=3113737 RepID=UPI002E16DF63|nr:glycoside hydrolase family 25 protein [Bergeyella sp. RCAD1439]